MVPHFNLNMFKKLSKDLFAYCVSLIPHTNWTAVENCPRMFFHFIQEFFVKHLQDNIFKGYNLL